MGHSREMDTAERRGFAPSFEAAPIDVEPGPGPLVFHGTVTGGVPSAEFIERFSGSGRGVNWVVDACSLTKREKIEQSR